MELDGVGFAYRLEVEHDRRERRARIASETLVGNGGPLFSFVGGDMRLHRDDHSEGPPFKSDWRESALARVQPVKDNVHLSAFLDFKRGVLVCVDTRALVGVFGDTDEAHVYKFRELSTASGR